MRRIEGYELNGFKTLGLASAARPNLMPLAVPSICNARLVP
jgi:hypothetical protein